MNKDSNELNHLIGRFETLYADFLSREHKAIYIEKNKGLADSFLLEINDRFAYSGHAYFRIYMEYALAEFQAFAQLMSRQVLYEKYIRQKPLYYEHPLQMQFLKNYYDAYFTRHPKLSIGHIKSMINNNVSLFTLLDSLGMDSTLVNEELRSWVGIYAMQQALQNPEYEATHLLYLLSEMGKNEKFPYQKKLISFVINKYQREIKSVLFKKAILTDSKKQNIDVEKLLEKGKFHYVLFFSGSSTLCPACRAELELLKKIYAPYQNEVKVIVVQTDYDFDLYYNYYQQNKFPYIHLYFNKEIDWLRQLGVVHQPCAVLFDDKGSALSKDYNLPSKRLELEFKKMQEIVKASKSNK